jgi:hypothetical protein
MLSGLEILLERMKMYPEEFNVHGKWAEMIEDVRPYLDSTEAEALRVGFGEIMRSNFNEGVLKTLACEPIISPYESMKSLTYKTSARYL